MMSLFNDCSMTKDEIDKKYDFRHFLTNIGSHMNGIFYVLNPFLDAAVAKSTVVQQHR